MCLIFINTNRQEQLGPYHAGIRLESFPNIQAKLFRKKIS